MASRVSQKPLIFQNEIFDIHQKKDAINEKTRSSKTATKRSGLGLGGRKALNDITNKPLTNQEASSKKKVVQKEEFNIAGEAFLHDHKKCIEAQEAVMNTFYLDLVLPGHDSVSTSECPKSKKAKSYLDNLYHMDLEEYNMSEFSDWMESSTRWCSRPSSPINWDSLPPSPFAWQSKAVEFVLKDENDVQN